VLVHALKVDPKLTLVAMRVFIGSRYADLKIVLGTVTMIIEAMRTAVARECDTTSVINKDRRSKHVQQTHSKRPFERRYELSIFDLWQPSPYFVQERSLLPQTDLVTES